MHGGRAACAAAPDQEGGRHERKPAHAHTHANPPTRRKGTFSVPYSLQETMLLSRRTSRALDSSGGRRGCRPKRRRWAQLAPASMGARAAVVGDSAGATQRKMAGSTRHLPPCSHYNATTLTLTPPRSEGVPGEMVLGLGCELWRGRRARAIVLRGQRREVLVKVGHAHVPVHIRAEGWCQLSLLHPLPVHPSEERVLLYLRKGHIAVGSARLMSAGEWRIDESDNEVRRWARRVRNGGWAMVVAIRCGYVCMYACCVCVHDASRTLSIPSSPVPRRALGSRVSSPLRSEAASCVRYGGSFNFSDRIFFCSNCRLRALNGCLPVSISNSNTPTLHQSAGRPCPLAVTTSGAWPYASELAQRAAARTRATTLYPSRESFG